MVLSKKNILLTGLLILASSTCISSQTVYVNSHGIKYHNETCAQLGRNRSAIDLREAQMKGYKLCSSCSAARKDETEGNNQKKEDETKIQSNKAEEKTDN